MSKWVWNVKKTAKINIDTNTQINISDSSTVYAGKLSDTLYQGISMKDAVAFVDEITESDTDKHLKVLMPLIISAIQSAIRPTKEGIVCVHCGLSFDSLDQFNAHMRDVH